MVQMRLPVAVVAVFARHYAEFSFMVPTNTIHCDDLPGYTAPIFKTHPKANGLQSSTAQIPCEMSRK